MTSQADTTPRHVIVTSTKSVGIQILLIFFLGPFGLFYSTIKGALIIIFGVPFAFGLLAVVTAVGGSSNDNVHTAAIIALGSEIVLMVLAWWIGSFIWGVVAVNGYNRRLMAKAS